MSLDAFFFDVAGVGRDGRRFCLHQPPAGGGAAVRGAVLYVHPFAEEMNKSRRMAALQSQALAAAGHAVLRIDLHGCGDSGGDFGDASWDGWIDDIAEGARWLRRRYPAPLWLWGLRAGCLLAADAAGRIGGDCNFLFWQPLASGRQPLQQLLRLKAAAQLQGGDAKQVMEQSRRELAEGGAVEVAGYTVSSTLARGLEAAALPPPSGRGRLEWFDISTRVDGEPPAAVANAAARWQRPDFAVRGHHVNGPAFWQSSEIELAPALLDATVAALVDGPQAAA